MRGWIGVWAMVGLVGCAGGSDDAGGDPSGSGAAGSGASGAGAHGAGGGSAGAGASDPGPPCLPGGFCLEYPQLTDAELNAVHGSSGADIWAVGARGTALRSTDGGATFARVGTGVDVALHGVFAVAPDDAWAVGEAGTLLHWDGSSWKAADSKTEVELRDVTVDAAGTVWAAGGDDGSGVVVTGQGDSWSTIATGECVGLRAVVARQNGSVLVGGRTAGAACVVRILEGAAQPMDWVDPHPHDPAYSIGALTEVGGAVWGILEGYNVTAVIHESGGWALGTEAPSGAPFTDLTARVGGGVWVSGAWISTEAGMACDGSAPGATRAIWSSPEGDLVAVGGGGLAAKLDAQSGCTVASTIQPLVSDAYLWSDLPAVDGEGTPWFLVGADAWELGGGTWKKAFTFPDVWQGNWAQYVSSFAVCGDGSARLVAHYYLGDDANGNAVYQPIPHRWARGDAKPHIDDVAFVIETEANTLLLDQVECDAGGGEWYGYASQQSGFRYWYPLAAVDGVIPTEESSCLVSGYSDTNLTAGGSPFFTTDAGTVSVGDGVYHDAGVMAFDGETCRPLGPQDWPALGGYVSTDEYGGLELGSGVRLAGAGGLDDVWLASPPAMAAAAPSSQLELAHLSAGAWTTVRIPLDAEVAASINESVAAYGGGTLLSPRVTSAGDLVLVAVTGLYTDWLLLYDGQTTAVVRGSGHTFSGGYHFAAQDKLWTLELPGTVFTRPL